MAILFCCVALGFYHIQCELFGIVRFKLTDVVEL